MNDKILTLLQSQDEGDNIIGLILFKKEKKATHRKLCLYITENLGNLHGFKITSKYFKNHTYNFRPQMRYKWRKAIEKT